MFLRIVHIKSRSPATAALAFGVATKVGVSVATTWRGHGPAASLCFRVRVRADTRRFTLSGGAPCVCSGGFLCPRCLVQNALRSALAGFTATWGQEHGDLRLAVIIEAEQVSVAVRVAQQRARCIVTAAQGKQETVFRKERLGRKPELQILENIQLYLPITHSA